MRQAKGIVNGLAVNANSVIVCGPSVERSRMKPSGVKSLQPHAKVWHLVGSLGSLTTKHRHRANPYDNVGPDNWHNLDSVRNDGFHLMFRLPYPYRPPFPEHRVGPVDEENIVGMFNK